MDKNTLSNYGWIVIAVLVLSVMIALATPFGEYIKAGVESTTQGLFDTSEKALNVVGMSAKTDETEKATTSGSYISVNDVAPIQHNLKVNLSSDTVTDFSGVTVTKTGKNLLDMSTIYKTYGVTSANVIDANTNSIKLVKSTGAQTENGVSFKIYLPANTYSISVTELSGDGVIYGSTMHLYNSQGEQIDSVYFGVNDTSSTFNILESGEYQFAFFSAWSAPENNIVEYKNIQVEIGDTKTDFESYTKQSVKANADGTVSGLASVSPNMTIIADADVEITCEYQKKN